MINFFKRKKKKSSRLTGPDILDLSDMDEELLGYLRSDLSLLGNLLADNNDLDYQIFGAALERIDVYLTEIKIDKKIKGKTNE